MPIRCLASLCPKQECVAFMMSQSFAFMMSQGFDVTLSSVLGLQVNTGLQPPTRWKPFVAGTMLRCP